MPNNFTFGNPALSNELDKAYGCSDNKEKVNLRESDDVSNFLKEVEKFERESVRIKLKFG